MDHNYAIENHTAERYLLHELPEDERDAYEEHFFNCLVCAEEIKSASDFMETARQVVQAELHAPLYAPPVHHSWVWGSWLNWRTMLQPIPAMACILFLAVSVFSAYQNGITIPAWKAKATAAQHQAPLVAQINPPKPVLLSESRDQNQPIVTDKNTPINLQFDITLTGYSAYDLGITTADGVEKVPSRAVSAQEARYPVHMIVPAGALESGSYVVVIQGVNSNGTESRVKGKSRNLPFQLKIQD